jgi:hypothetical protein
MKLPVRSRSAPENTLQIRARRDRSGFRIDVAARGWVAIAGVVVAMAAVVIDHLLR